jgi:DNA-binding response OmpR family regulator
VPDHSHSCHVLIVDDDPGFAHGLAAALRQHAFETDIATSFFEALDIIDQLGTPIDIIIIDLKLPQGNGVALSRMARLRRPYVKVLYVTGYHEMGLSPDIGDVPVLGKPLQIEDLVRAIETVLRPPEQPAAAD